MAEQFDTESFHLPGNRIGCLLIHGFTATPYDMRFFAEKLHACGFSVAAVRLAGHGTHVNDLEPCSWLDWYDSAAEALRQLAATTEVRVVVGQSMGALLALKLAHDLPAQVDAVVSVSTALIASPWLDRCAPLLPYIVPALPRRWRFLHKGSSDIADDDARNATPTYAHMPLRSIHQLNALQRQVRPLLPMVRQPCLAIHSRQDHTCPLDNLELLERELAGPVQRVVLDASFHVVSVDRDKAQAADAICQFVSTLAPH